MQVVVQLAASNLEFQNKLFVQGAIEGCFEQAAYTFKIWTRAAERSAASPPSEAGKEQKGIQ